MIEKEGSVCPNCGKKIRLIVRETAGLGFFLHEEVMECECEEEPQLDLFKNPDQ